MRVWAAAILATGLLAGATGCIPLPLKRAPGLHGAVVDTRGEPIAGAHVVVRFDGSYDEILGEWDLLGHREATTDENGRFRFGNLHKDGFSAWPWFEARSAVVGVIRDGFSCADRAAALDDGSVRVVLRDGVTAEARRDSCRPVPAAPREAPGFWKAWNALQEVAIARDEPRDSGSIAAKRPFGFGMNCRGPVLDAALAPDGVHLARMVTRQRDATTTLRLQILELGEHGPPVIAHAAPVRLRPEVGRLAWISDGELAWLEESLQWRDPDRPSTSRTPPGMGRFARVLFDRTARDSAALPASRPPSPTPQGVRWTATPKPVDPAAPANAATRIDPVVAGDEDRHDRAALRWRDRTFTRHQRVDPNTGLPTTVLRVTRPGGATVEARLPGEACGRTGRFGRPEFALTQRGDRAVDLRYVDGGCQLVSIDLRAGTWESLATAAGPSTCQTSRDIPASQLRAGFPDYAETLQTALERSKLDPKAAFRLVLGPGRAARLEVPTETGRTEILDAPPFPMETPLRVIGVSTLGLHRLPALVD